MFLALGTGLRLAENDWLGGSRGLNRGDHRACSWGNLAALHGQQRVGVGGHEWGAGHDVARGFGQFLDERQGVVPSCLPSSNGIICL